MKSEFVSIREEPRSSEPTAITSAVRSSDLAHISMNPGGQQPHHEAQTEIGIDAGHRVVRHDAKSSVKKLEAIRRIRLDHVEHSKQEEASHRAGPSNANERQRHEHPEYFVD